MVENSPAGLVMLGAEVSVTVTREEHHQAVLARYPVRYGERQVAAELGWCVIRSGKHRGRRAIEVRLDGQRVGELTHLMSERYAPLVSQVASAGGRPGCAAVIRLGAKGLELTLRLPRDGDGTIPIPAYPVGAVPVGPVPIPAYPVGAVPVGAPEPVRRRGLFSSYKPAWIAAAIVLIAFFAAIGSGEDDPSPSTAADNTTTTTTPPPVTTTTTTPPPTTTAAPAPRTTVEAPAPAPAPPPVKPKPKPKPAPKPAPEPVSDCDPNYGGCVPVASDVDCAGGSGNGPAYVDGPVQVIGNDIYDLDRDGDGTGCD